MTDDLAGNPRSHRSTLSGNPFPPIAEYGFLSNCEVTALIAASGNVEWMCLPRMDSPSVFAAILDRGAGRFRLGPADVTVPAGRQYLPGTMVLETTWATRRAGPSSVTSFWSGPGAMNHAGPPPISGYPRITGRTGSCCARSGA